MQSRQYKRTGGIAYAGSPYHIEEGCVQFIEQRKLRRFVHTVKELFINALEHKIAGMALERIGDLRAYSLILGKNGVVISGHSIDTLTRVVVYVDHDIKKGLQ